MNTANIPFQLADGLVLDSPMLILPWDKEVADLASIGSPQVEHKSNVTFVNWMGNSVFGGIGADVTFRSDCRNVFWLEPGNKQQFSSVMDAYNFVLPQLVGHLGEPHIVDVSYDGYPWNKWHYGDIRISLRIAERFTEYLSFIISKGIK